MVQGKAGGLDGWRVRELRRLPLLLWEWAARLLAEGIEFRHVSEEADVAQLCAEQILV